MKLTGRNHVVIDRSLADTMRAFKKCGYDGLELSIARATTNLVSWDYLEDSMIAVIKELSEQLELPVCSMSCHMGFTTDDNVFEADKKMIQQVRKYGTDIVIISTPAAEKRRELAPEGIYGQMTKRLKELCTIAEYNGVTIALETEPNQLLHNMDLFYEYAEKINSPALKLNMDIGHLYLSEADMYEALKKAGPWIVHSHIDNMCRGEHCHKLPWAGDIDLLKAYQMMKDLGFDGAVGLDLYIQDYLSVSEECVSYIKNNIFAKLK